MNSWERLVDVTHRCLVTLADCHRGIVVAVSGGADSIALLRALTAARSESTPLVVAHLNHGLRGPESDADAEFVREQSELLKLPFELGHIDIRRLAEQTSTNLEATARQERYAWLSAVAARHGASCVATGHNADDQAETVLHRLLRGTGLQGLRGIAERRPLVPGVTLVRPLLGVTRAEIMAGLREISQKWREDSSNVDRDFTRNRIRHELLPHLKEIYNPGLVQVLARLASQAAEACDVEEAEAAILLADTELPRAGDTVILKADVLATASARLIRALLRLIWNRESWLRGALTFEHYEHMVEVVRGTSGALDLPGGYHLARRGRVIQVGPRAKK